MTTRGRLLWSAVALLALAAIGASLAAGVDTGAARSGTGGPGPETVVAGPGTGVAARPAPPLAGPTLDGGRFDLADWRGRVVVVNMWASWCAPCREELPLLADAARRWSGAGLRVVGLDVRDRDEAATDLLARAGASDLTVVRDPEGTRAVSWGVHGLPETFVVDREGRIRLRVRGPVTAEWLRQRIPPLLERP